MEDAPESTEPSAKKAESSPIERGTRLTGSVIVALAVVIMLLIVLAYGLGPRALCALKDYRINHPREGGIALDAGNYYWDSDKRECRYQGMF